MRLPAFGSSSFSIPCKPISSTVTFIGRSMIEHSKKSAEKWFDGSYCLKDIKNGDEIIKTEKDEKKIKDLTTEDKLQTPSGHWKNIKTIENVSVNKIVTDDGIFITV